MSSVRVPNCQTCRRRKVKCDQRKPTCLRCEKGGFRCDGYATPLHFRMAIPPGGPKPGQQLVIAKPREFERTVAPEKPPEEVPESLSLVAFKPTFCYAYLFDNFVWTTFGYIWLEDAAKGRLTPLAERACSALSKSNFGNTLRQKQIKVEGSIAYGQTIKDLIPMLANPKSPGSEHLLIPILLLTIHDSSFKNLKGVASHMRGLMQLLMVCGPEKFQSGSLLYAFKSCRAMMTTGLIIARKRTFLEQEKWRTVPWALETTTKTNQDSLGDILVMVPGFLQDDDEVQNTDDPELKKDLIARVEAQLIKLYEWRWRWQMQNCLGVWHVEAGDIPRTTIHSERLLHFVSFEFSVDMMIYNSAQIWFFGLLYRLLPEEASIRIVAAAMTAASRCNYIDTGVETPLNLPGSHVSFRAPAIEIGQIFEYQCVQSAKTASYWYLFPMGLAYGILEHEERYRKWLRAMLDLSPITSRYIAPDGGNETGFGFYLSAGGLRQIIREGDGRESGERLMGDYIFKSHA